MSGDGKSEKTQMKEKTETCASCCNSSASKTSSKYDTTKGAPEERGTDVDGTLMCGKKYAKCKVYISCRPARTGCDACSKRK